MDDFIFRTPPRPENYGLKKHVSNFYFNILRILFYVGAYSFLGIFYLYELSGDFFERRSYGQMLCFFGGIAFAVLYVKFVQFYFKAESYVGDYRDWVDDYSKAQQDNNK